MGLNVIPISEARAKLPQLVEDAATLSRRSYLSVKGQVKAVIVDPKEIASLEATLEILSDKRAMKAIEQSKKDIAAGRVYDWEEVKKELESEV